MNDKDFERRRYDDCAVQARASLQSESGVHGGAALISRVLGARYTYYVALLQEVLGPDSVVLEIGSGAGEFTDALLRRGAKVAASDISMQSLELLRIRYAGNNNLSTLTCDMEILPFPDGMFDAVVNAASLSYGDNRLILSHIYPLLKPGGCFICVGSLNHNAVYSINRYIHFLRGYRSYSTLQQMPTADLIRQYQTTQGGKSSVYYFGGFSWLIMVFAKLGFESFWANVADRFYRLCRVRRSAFKFVLMARKGL